VSCNCKASSYVIRTKRRYGYELPTKKNVKIGSKIKMLSQALLIWALLILLAPIIIIILIFFKIFKKDFKLLKKIKIRL
jgi:hypothetical protein